MTGSYTEVQRRAAIRFGVLLAIMILNQCFWQYTVRKQAGFYMNLVIGLAYKYFGQRHLQNFLCGGREIAGSRCWMIWLDLYRTDRVQA